MFRKSSTDFPIFSETNVYFYKPDISKMLHRLVCLVNLSLFYTALSGLYCQSTYTRNQDKILNQQAEDLRSFSEYIYGKDVRLVIGKIYSQPYPKANGHPFMKSTNWMTGSVTVNGKEFSGLKLNYDICQDYLIYLDESPDGDKKTILLNKYSVEGFTVEDNKFITLSPEDADNLDEYQYFEVLNSGKVSLYNKWNKKFEPVTSQEFPAGRFLDTKITRYLLKDKVLYKVSNRIVLLRICADRKSELRKYMRKHKIDFRKGMDKPLAGLIEYYNELIKD
jgi:uncharacterized lipoprotein YehR (DUF1307 family)